MGSDLPEDRLVLEEQGDQNDEAYYSDKEVCRKLGLVVSKGEKQSDLVADEPRTETEDQRIGSQKPSPVEGNPKPSGYCNHSKSVPKMVKVDFSLNHDDRRVQDGKRSRTKEGHQEPDYAIGPKRVAENSLAH